jgi:hypothetical protein
MFPLRMGPTVLTNSNATLLTATKPTIVTSLTFTNTDSSERTVTVNLVPSGGTAAQGNRVVSALPIEAHDTYIQPLDIVMSPGDTLQGLASVTNVVNIMATYGDEKKLLRGL